MKKERNKGQRLNEFLTDYVIFDLETTDYKVNYAEIIEIGAIKVRAGEVVDTFQTLVKPDFDIPSTATAVNGITNEMVADAPYIYEILDDFLSFIGEDVLVGHNITTFDMNVLYDYIEEIKGECFSNRFVDTLYISRNLLPDLESHSLSHICEAFSVNVSNAHRALADCYLTKECYENLKVRYDKCGIPLKRVKKKSQGRHFSDETKELQLLEGFLKGITADNKLSVEEIMALKEWVDNSLHLAGNYPFDLVLTSLNRVLEDGIISQEELDDLLKLYKKFTAPVEAATHDEITCLNEKHCCVTGEFNYGSRKVVEEYIEQNGGICDKTVKKATDYLIVGSLGSENWKHGNYGGKVKKAMEYNEKSANISIVSEEEFFNEMGCCCITDEKYEMTYNWKDEIMKALETLIIKHELPEKSLYLMTNTGRKNENITSYSVAIYEPDYPEVPGSRKDQTRNSIVLRIIENEKLEVICSKYQYEDAMGNISGKVTTKELKSDPDNKHIIFDKEDFLLIEFIKASTEYKLKNYISKASTFGCCSRFVECSDQKKCIHENKLYSKACAYRRNLDAGRIFYGKNKNV